MQANEVLFDSALVLVAIVPSPKDLEIARILGWYRIPLRMAPKVVAVDYLLFYQTGKFASGHDALIESFAEVKGVELTLRKDLIRNEPEHPRANEEYYKISLGAMKNLPRPIRAEKWKRITFFYTLGSLVNQAESVTDLVVRSEERDVLWKTIRERSGASYVNNVQPLSPGGEKELQRVLQQVILLNSELGIELAINREL